jgi:hypothetical protein
MPAPHNETMTETLARLAYDDAVDPMSYALACALGVATTDFYLRNEWDEEARLFTVIRRDEPDGTGLLVEELAMPSLPEDAHPATYIRLVAEVMREHGGDMPHSDIVAWLFIVEAYMLAGSTERLAEYERVAGARQLHVHPERAECRVAVMVDRAGRTYQTITERGGGVPWLMMTGTTDSELDVLGGRITEELRVLMDSTPIAS